jgi:hypothetical protein
MAQPVPFGRPQRLDPDDEKRLPVSLEHERAVLAAILLDSKSEQKAFETASSILAVEDFFHHHHQRLFAELGHLLAAGIEPDLVTICERLRDRGDLERCGGAAYISSLVDGSPRISNVAYYARQVKEKSALRRLIYTLDAAKQTALEGHAEPSTLISETAQKVAMLDASPGGNPSVVIGFQTLLTMPLPPAEFICQPIFTRGGTMMFFGPKSVGKSWIVTEGAARLALGPEIVGKMFLWPILKPQRLCYMYGEMHGGEIQNRAQQIAKGHGLMKLPEDFDKRFGIMAKEFQRLPEAPKMARTWRPSIATPKDRKYVQERIIGAGCEVLVLDNVSTLWPSSQEGDSERAAILQDWEIELNWLGISVIVVQHARKAGDEMIGSSTQSHILDSVVKLCRPANYEREQQLRAELRVENIRHSSSDPQWLAPFELSLRVDEYGATWLMKPAKWAQMAAGFDMLADGAKPYEVARDLGISVRSAYRWQKQQKENPNVKTWTGEKD